MSSMLTNLWIDLAALIVSISALIVSISALIIALSSKRIAVRGVRNEALTQVRAWGGDVLELIAEIDFLCSVTAPKAASGSTQSETLILASRVSAVLDRGRMFFPNNARDYYGLHKHEEDRGVRPPILDLLVILYDLLTGRQTSGIADNVIAASVQEVRHRFLAAMKKATILNVPLTPEEYEDHLNSITVQPLPADMFELVVPGRKFELEFHRGTQLTTP